MTIKNPKSILKPVTALFRSKKIQIEKISFLGKGEGSAVYKIESSNQMYCLKTALFPKRSKKVLNEAKIRQDFIDKGLKFVPSPIFIDQEYFEHGAVIYEFIEGAEPNFSAKKDLSQMAKCLAEIHLLEYKINSDGIEQIWKNYQFLQKITESIQKRYAHLVNDKITQAFSKALDEYKQYIEKGSKDITYGVTSILHGDISDNCITDTQGKLWLIDWENSEYGDIVDEISGFVYYAVKDKELQDFFYQEYQQHFKPAQEMNLKKLCDIFSMAFPVFNVCWGIDQLNSNLIHKLEPERKLRDILKSARNWSGNFSDKTSEVILQGANQMMEEISKQL